MCGKEGKIKTSGWFLTTERVPERILPGWRGARYATPMARRSPREHRCEFVDLFFPASNKQDVPPLAGGPQSPQAAGGGCAGPAPPGLPPAIAGHDAQRAARQARAAALLLWEGTPHTLSVSGLRPQLTSPIRDVSQPK